MIKKKEIEAKSILRTHKRIDSWFVSRYGMNLYRGCFHDCVYCDGRAEKYQVEGDFSRNIQVKTNALKILERELDPSRHRKSRSKCYVAVGGGVNDSYQPLERHYRLTRGALELLLKFGYPTLILTKSPFVKEDSELIEAINEKSGAVVAVSFSSVDKEISRVFEPTVAPPENRLEIIKYFKSKGIPCAMFLMPVIPFVTDNQQYIESSLQAAKDVGADYVIFSGMTLKSGRQMDYFMGVLEKYNPKFPARYKSIYRSNDQWGSATSEYYNDIQRTFHDTARKVKIPVRMPRVLFQDILDPGDLLLVILEHMDYMLKLRGAQSPYGYIANILRSSLHPIETLSIETLKDRINTLSGIQASSLEIVKEILASGTSRLYEKLVSDYRPQN